MMHRFLTFIALVLFALPLRADPYENALRLEVLPGWRSADGSHVAGLRLRLADGWKTYWRAPGDAGVPPMFDWSQSGNLSGAEIIWPVPEVFSQNGMRSIGYKHDVILPLRIAPNRTDRQIHLKGLIDLGICNDICVPRRLRIDVTLPADTIRPVPAIAAAMAARPLEANEAGVTSARCALRPSENGIGLTAVLRMPTAGGTEFAVIETDNPQVWVSEARAARNGPDLVVDTELMHVTGQSFLVNRAGIRITVLGRKYSVDVRGCTSG